MPSTAAGRKMRANVHSVRPMVPVERSHESVTMLTIVLKAAMVGLTRSGAYPWLMKKMTAMAPLIPETPENATQEARSEAEREFPGGRQT